MLICYSAHLSIDVHCSTHLKTKNNILFHPSIKIILTYFLLQPAVLLSKLLNPFLFYFRCAPLQASEPISFFFSLCSSQSLWTHLISQAHQALSSLKLFHLSSSSSSIISQAHQAPIFLIGLSFILVKKKKMYKYNLG